MPKIWVTSDLHLGHSKPFLWEPRGFTSSLEHDKTIIKNWNELVAQEDEVYILGDLMLEDNEYGLKCLQQLNGHFIVIRGNHDSDNRIELYNNENKIWAIKDAYRLNYNGYHFYLSHYPTLTANFDNKPPKKVLINLHGHIHGKEKFYNDLPYIYNCALDAHDNKPILLDDIIEDIKAKASSC